jgi:IclR family transcriptional regulator, acetate operon repressor
MLTAERQSGQPVGVGERREAVPSVAQRILLTLEACAANEGSLTLTELVSETGLPKTTLHRTCWKLVELGLLDHCEDGFAVGVKVFALGNSNPLLNEIRIAAMPILLELQRSTNQMSNLAVLHDGKALIIDALYAPQPVLPRLVGGALPLHCTAVGKAIAASLAPDDREELLGEGPLPPATWRTIVRPTLLREHLGRVASEGIAVSDEEFMAGICGVAAAFSVRGRTTVAVGFVGMGSRVVVNRVTGPVRDAAAALQRELA